MTDYQLVAFLSDMRILLDESGREDTPPPARAEAVLLWMLPKSQRDSLIGDLGEEYRTLIVPKLGERAARLWYWKQAIFSAAPIIGGWLRRTSIIGGAAWLFDWISGRLG